MSVVQDQAKLDLKINNEQVLQRQLEATQDRFRVGEITKTDIKLDIGLIKDLLKEKNVISYIALLINHFLMTLYKVLPFA